MNYCYINKNKIYAFESKNVFLDYIRDEKKILVALNAEKLNKNDEKLTEIINENIGYADGVGGVWALKRKGLDSTKIAGAEFWLDIIEKYEKEKSFYIIGSSEEVINETVTKLKNQFPNLDLKGFRNGFLKEGDKQGITQELKDKNPDVVFVAMGSPMQEFLMSEFLKSHKALYMGLGGSFDVYTGLKKRAPGVFIKLGLEWFYRLLKEPTRWRRQLTYISFTLKVLTNRI